MEHTPISTSDAKAAPPIGALPPIMLDTLAAQGLRELTHAPIAKVARVLAHFDREQLGIAIEIMVAMLDVADGEPDAEDATDLEDDFELSPIGQNFADRGAGCSISDRDEVSATEWHTRRAHDRPGPGLVGKDGRPLHEDDELIGDEEDGTHAEDEAGIPRDLAKGMRGAGCPISDIDKAIDDDACDEPEEGMEREQMADDVPAPPVYSLDHNIFNDRRTFLGMNAATWIGKPIV